MPQATTPTRADVRQRCSRAARAGNRYASRQRPCFPQDAATYMSLPSNTVASTRPPFSGASRRFAHDATYTTRTGWHRSFPTRSRPPWRSHLIRHTNSSGPALGAAGVKQPTAVQSIKSATPPCVHHPGASPLSVHIGPEARKRAGAHTIDQWHAWLPAEDTQQVKGLLLGR